MSKGVWVASALLFDLDGTLINSVELIVRSYTHTLTTHLGQSLDRPAILRTIGLPLEPMLESLAPGRGPQLMQTYSDYMYAHHDTLVQPYPGVLAVLRELRTRGYHLGIVTSKGRPAASQAFRRWSLDTLVDVTICAEDTPRLKPAPDPLFAAATALNLTPATCCYVGDTPHDLHAARAAGMRAIAAPWGAGTHADLHAAEPDLWLAACHDLLDHYPGPAPT